MIGLAFLGLIAAASAGFLMLSLKASPAGAEAAPTLERETILVAARDLSSKTILGLKDIKLVEVPRDSGSSGVLRDPTQAVGRLLVSPLLAGQQVTNAVFAVSGTGLHLASAIEEGMRAVSVNLTDSMGIENLLSPGCMVDVLAGVDFAEPIDSALTTTILERVLVLGIGGRTIVNAETESFNESGRRRPSVTLLMRPEEAEIVKLASELGRISFTLRNPMEGVDAGLARSESRISELSPALSTLAMHLNEVREKRQQMEDLAMERDFEAAQFALEKNRLEFELTRKEYARKMEADEVLKTSQNSIGTASSEWTVKVIRGLETLSVVFDTDTMHYLKGASAR